MANDNEAPTHRPYSHDFNTRWSPSFWAPLVLLSSIIFAAFVVAVRSSLTHAISFLWFAVIALYLLSRAHKFRTIAGVAMFLTSLVLFALFWGTTFYITVIDVGLMPSVIAAVLVPVFGIFALYGLVMALNGMWIELLWMLIILGLLGLVDVVSLHVLTSRPKSSSRSQVVEVRND